jgi:hypothetical protein
MGHSAEGERALRCGISYDDAKAEWAKHVEE